MLLFAAPLRECWKTFAVPEGYRILPLRAKRAMNELNPNSTIPVTHLHQTLPPTVQRGQKGPLTQNHPLLADQTLPPRAKGPESPATRGPDAPATGGGSSGAREENLIHSSLASLAGVIFYIPLRGRKSSETESVKKLKKEGDSFIYTSNLIN
jgi:hypothetical protein